MSGLSLKGLDAFRRSLASPTSPRPGLLSFQLCSFGLGVP